jgi:hypothetical protein
VYTPGAVVVGVVPTYGITANPQKQDQTGVRYFFTDQSGVIRQNVGGAASNTSTPISN